MDSASTYLSRGGLPEDALSTVMRSIFIYCDINVPFLLYFVMNTVQGSFRA